MLCKYFSEELLGLQDAEIKNIETDKEKTVITIRMKRKPHKCPCCCKETNRIHDYRKQVIKDIPSFGKQVILNLEKRRYVYSCGKDFMRRFIFFPNITE